MSILYPLSFFELFIINRKSVRFTAGIPDTSRIGTVGGEVANLGNDALRTDIDVLGVASALVGYQIRTDIERELRRAGASARALGVHVELFTLTAGLHRAFTVGIVSVGMVVVYLGHGIRILFRAVVRILHFGQLELFALSLAVGIGIVNNRLLSGQKTK